MELEKIISYFEELSAIPRQSGDEKAASDYLVNFAKESGLWVKQDEYYNVIVKKPATEGMEDREPVIIQGHIDMVYVKAEGAEHTYANGIEVIDDGEFLHANGTTLGADNGIAVSYAMMLMASKDIPHPALEFIFTVEEEVGLLGAANLDVSELEGKMVMKLDTEEEGSFCSGCAGGVRSTLRIPAAREKAEGVFIPVDVLFSGLKGGHSGMEIHMERGNAIQLLGRVLGALKACDVKVGAVESLGKSNAIASSAKLRIYVKEHDLEAVTGVLNELEKVFQNELAASDFVEITVKTGEAVSECQVFTEETVAKLRGVLTLMPQGVMNMSMAVPGLVQTSVNTGNMEERDGNIILDSALRSSVDSQKYFLKDKIQAVADAYGLVCEWTGDYPGWQYKEESKLRDIAAEKYRELFGKEPTVEAIHAGLECGYWAAKIQDADILSLGPDMYDVHSPKERISKKSIANVWELIKAILK